MPDGPPARDVPFSQRYRYEALPEPMQLEQISRPLRVEIWNMVRQELLADRAYGVEGYYFRKKGRRRLERIIGRLTGCPDDEVDTDYVRSLRLVKGLLLEGKFFRVLDFLERLCNDALGGPDLATRIQRLFEKNGAAYSLNSSRHPFWFMPRSSREQGEATRVAVEVVRDEGMNGAVTHLRKAAEAMNDGQYAESVANSVHAVESIARLIDPEGAKTLGPALKSLERHGLLKHEALAKAFSTLYGYTSDEQGIRHALLDKEEPDVGLDEAVFMYGACACFAAYLVGKNRRVGQAG